MFPEANQEILDVWSNSPVRGLVKVFLLSGESFANMVLGSMVSPESGPFLFVKFLAERAQDPGVLLESLFGAIGSGMRHPPGSM